MIIVIIINNIINITIINANSHTAILTYLGTYLLTYLRTYLRTCLLTYLRTYLLTYAEIGLPPINSRTSFCEKPRTCDLNILHRQQPPAMMVCGVAVVGLNFRWPLGRFACFLETDLSLKILVFLVLPIGPKFHQFTDQRSVPRWENFGCG